MDEDSEHTSPAVRLGRAVEEYAHAVRMGDAEAAQTAEDALAAAKVALAAEQELPPEIRRELDRDIQTLRERLAARRSEDELGMALVPEALRAQALSEMEIGELAAASLVAGARPHALAYVVAAGRRAVWESSRVRLASLGEELAHELAEVDGALARAQAALDALREGREPVTSEEQLDGGAGAPRNLGEVALGALVVVAAAAQVQLTHVALQRIFSWGTSLLVALGYVIGIVVAAGAIGRWLALGRARSRSTATSLLASPLALLCAAAVMVSTLATRGLSATDLVSNAIGNSAAAPVADRIVADGVLTVVQLLFVVVSVAFGYQVAGRGQRRELRRGEAVRERPSVLRERRRALLREYVARGMSVRAEARRLDALYLHETLQRAPLLGDMLAETLEDPLPRWMRDACDELDAWEAQRSGSTSAVTARMPR